MNNQELQTFLNIIDGRIKKYINENKLLKQYCGIITAEVLEGSSKKYKVRILGNETEFIFLNKTGESLVVGDNVFIQTIGTDLNTGVITYKAKESTNTIDYIVEQGTTGIWTYRKWNSGIAECWGKQTVSTVFVSNIGGVSPPLYYSKTPFPSIEYPFEFVEQPNIAAVLSNGVAGWLYYKQSSSQPTKSIGEYGCFRWSGLSDNSVEMSINYQIIGKWK